MTFLRIFAGVFVARMAIEGMEAMLGEPFTTGILWVVLIVVCGHLLYQRWHRR